MAVESVSVKKEDKDTLIRIVKASENHVNCNNPVILDIEEAKQKETREKHLKSLMEQLDEKKQEYKTVQDLLKKEKYSQKEKLACIKGIHPHMDKAAKIGGYTVWGGIGTTIAACLAGASGGLLGLCFLAISIGAIANGGIENTMKKEAAALTDEETREYYDKLSVKLLAEIEELKEQTGEGYYLAEI